MSRKLGLVLVCIFTLLLFNSFLEKTNTPRLFIIGDSTVKNGRGDGANGQ